MALLRPYILMTFDRDLRTKHEVPVTSLTESSIAGSIPKIPGQRESQAEGRAM